MTTGTETDDLLTAEAELEAAMLSGDIATLDRLLRDDLRYTGPDGTVSGKAEDLEAYRSGRLVVTSLQPSDLWATRAGDTGVTSVLARMAGLAGGRPFTTTLRYTRVWTRGPDGWQVLAAQASPVTRTGSAGGRDGRPGGPEGAARPAGPAEAGAAGPGGGGGTGGSADGRGGASGPRLRLEDHPTLVSGPVTVRPGRPADVAALSSILAEESVSRWWGPPEPPDDILAKIVGDDEETVLLVIEVDGRVAGGIEYSEQNHPQYRHAGIDIYLSGRHQGRGIGATAIALVARYLFEHREHHRITIDPAAENTRAIRCYEKVGFRPVGILRQYERGGDGEYHDGLLMDMLRDELVGPDSPPPVPAAGA